MNGVNDVKRFVNIINSKSNNMPFYHCYGIWFDGSACRFCTFFIDVDRNYIYGLCPESCANMYSMRYLQ